MEFTEKLYSTGQALVSQTTYNEPHSLVLFGDILFDKTTVFTSGHNSIETQAILKNFISPQPEFLFDAGVLTFSTQQFKEFEQKLREFHTAYWQSPISNYNEAQVYCSFSAKHLCSGNTLVLISNNKSHDGFLVNDWGVKKIIDIHNTLHSSFKKLDLQFHTLAYLLSAKIDNFEFEAKKQKLYYVLHILEQDRVEKEKEQLEKNIPSKVNNKSKFSTHKI